MMTAAAPVDAGSDRIANTADRLIEHIVPADRPIVVTGIVDLVDGEPTRRRLRRESWVDGSAQARLDELPGRYARFRLWTAAALVLLTVVTVLLTIAAVR
jgi:hypothetical protein